ncbi:MAG: nucleotide exchange factor GrpE [PVC group bacterium]|nr:nucleotide exchange factor GrpE [PVC group bacterium]
MKKKPKNDEQEEQAELETKIPEVQEEESVTIPKAEYEVLKHQEQIATERIARIQADFDNARKRMERDKLDFLRFSEENIISELVPFIDDFQRAFAAADKTKDFDVLHKGVEMILNHLLELLKKKGVKPIEAEGKLFDPAYHEAMMQVESEEHPENTVIEELQKGYMLNDKVLRTAKVKVSKQTEEEKE